MKPLVGIASLFRSPCETSAWIYREYFVNEAYVAQLEKAGALPYVLPYLQPEHIEEQLEPLSAVLVPGGHGVGAAAVYVPWAISPGARWAARSRCRAGR